MSGIEVAGLVLGAFPIVVSALEQYRNAFRPIKDWWKFERTLEDFINDLGLQSALFDNNLERLLSPFVDTEIRMGVLLRDPFGPAWGDPNLDGKLQARLGQSLAFYRTIVERMRSILDDLKQLLGMDKGQTLDLWQRHEPGRSEIKAEFKRLRIAFSKNKFHHVDSLSKQNENLARLLQSSDDLAFSRKQRNTTPNSDILRRLQSRALSLYITLSNAWTCSCQSHSTHLQLERRVVGNNVIDEHWKLLLPLKDAQSAFTALTKVEVQIEDDEASTDQLALPMPSGQTVVQSATHSDIYHVKREMDWRKSRRVASSTSTTTFARMTTALSSTPGAYAMDHIIASAAPSITYRGPKKQVAFAHSASPTPDASEGMRIDPPAPIDDMCSALNAVNDTTTCLGFLQDQYRRRHTFYPSKEKKTDSQLTLRDALKASSTHAHVQKMSKKDRLTVGMILASSLLQLHDTPWLGQRWTRDDVKLRLDETQTRVVPDPLIHKTFDPGSDETQASVSAQGGQKQSSRFSAKNALSDLGIALLELCFGRPIEDHPQRSEFFGPNNLPNAFTDISTARLWHEKIADKMGYEMSDCIRRCLDCAFAPKPNLEDQEFQEAFFNGVLVPLQEVLKVWEQD